MGSGWEVLLSLPVAEGNPPKLQTFSLDCFFLLFFFFLGGGGGVLSVHTAHIQIFFSLPFSQAVRLKGLLSAPQLNGQLGPRPSGAGQKGSAQGLRPHMARARCSSVHVDEMTVAVVY